MIEIRKATKDDIDFVCKLEPICFTAPFSKKDVEYEFKDSPVSIIYIAEDSNTKTKVGFIDYWHTFDSATICQIAVDPKCRRMGIGSLLLKEVIDDCYAKRVISLTLEVRENNKAAYNLYIKHGFKKILLKEHYYSNGDNAIYMVREEKL